MDLIVSAGGAADWGGRSFRCALGRTGIRADKREGDGVTPAGCFGLRRVLYRADRLARPPTALPVAALTPQDGWCDDPADPMYNRPVRLPYAARHERLWRADGRRRGGGSGPVAHAGAERGRPGAGDGPVPQAAATGRRRLRSWRPRPTLRRPSR
ncbi:MAG TPA: hypothetical protein VJJ77_04860, partial [Dongiaceae bacterium]|nr:hypothetical protein [Dongiaceae bacterium]